MTHRWSAFPNQAEAGFGELFKVVLVQANVLYGPWDSGAFWTKAVQGALKYKQPGGVNGPLFQYMLPRIAEELSIEVVGQC